MSGPVRPERDSDPAEELRAAAETAALADLSRLGKLAFQGPDSRQFLNGLVTNDILNLPTGQGFPCCVLTPKGKLVADFWMFNRGGDLLALGEPQACRALALALSKYLVLSKTRIEDLGGSLAALCLLGPRSREVLAAALGPVSLPARGHAAARWRDKPIDLLSYPVPAPEAVLLLVPAEAADALREAILEAGRPHGIQPLGREAYETLRVEAGVPVLGVDTDGDTLPLEANLEEAISFTKGCYMGQETTARIKNLGHVNRRLVGLRIEGSPPAGSPVRSEGAEVGRLTSVVRSPRLKATLALATVRAAQSGPGTALQVLHGGRELESVVVPLPVRGDGCPKNC